LSAAAVAVAKCDDDDDADDAVGVAVAVVTFCRVCKEAAAGSECTLVFAAFD
jgi:hypothetical protein